GAETACVCAHHRCGVVYNSRHRSPPRRPSRPARRSPDLAGTFWYHPHCNTLEQIGRGLAGLIVVEDPADPVFDAEIVLNLRDWRDRKSTRLNSSHVKSSYDVFSLNTKRHRCPRGVGVQEG